MNRLQHATSLLKVQVDTATTNAPIHEADGDAEQAALDRSVAASCRAALGILTRDPIARFSKHSDIAGVVIDHHTGLMWSAETIGAGMPWAEADTAAKEVRLGGFEDWRLPTVRELLSIVDYERHSPAIDTAFFDAVSDWYWTSSSWAPSPAGDAWIVYFGSGYAGACYRHYGARVRAVRSLGSGQ